MNPHDLDEEKLQEFKEFMEKKKNRTKEVELPEHIQNMNEDAPKDVYMNTSSERLKSKPETTSNPLTAYYRRPKFFIPLPTNGMFSTPGSIEFTPNGEVPVMPMGANDEYNLRNPEMLLNGTAMSQMVMSCCPAIKDIDELSSPDFDVLIWAIKKASDGDQYDLTTNCPNCKAENKIAISIGELIGKVKPFKPENCELKLDDLTLYIRPSTFQESMQLIIVSYENQQIVRALKNNDMDDDERARQVRKSTQKVLNIKDRVFSKTIRQIDLPDGTEVTNEEHILDFYKNAERNYVKKIEAKLGALNKVLNESVPIKCSKCKTDYETPIEYNPTLFFSKVS